MPERPYRPSPPPPDAEAARLAAQGQRRILDARASHDTVRGGADERKRDENLRVALGGHFGSPARAAAFFGFVAVGALLTLVDVVYDVDTFSVGELLLAGAIPFWVLVPPKATRARVAAEEAWASSLPFALDGYFDVLGAEPAMTCVLTATVAWADPRLAPGDGALQGMLGVLDTDSRAASRDAATAVIQSGPITDRAWVRVNRARFVHRNAPLVAYVHRLVDRVLLPLHVSRPIARVSLSRR